MAAIRRRLPCPRCEDGTIRWKAGHWARKVCPVCNGQQTTTVKNVKGFLGKHGKLRDRRRVRRGLHRLRRDGNRVAGRALRTLGL